MPSESAARSRARPARAGRAAPVPGGAVAGAVCLKCGRRSRNLDASCPRCGPEGVLEIEFDLARARRTLNARSLAARSPAIWRYRELLPLPASARVPPLAPGGTPIVDAPRLAPWAGLRTLRLKDEGRNPTASFKDRASAVGVARALLRGAGVVACASTGNAASSLAGAAASVGLRAVIFVPESAPEPKVAQLLVFGARVVRVKGSYDETWEMCQRACARHGWYNRNAAVNPSLVEGKKTCGLEIGEQLALDPPDWVAVSVGDGCTIAGTWKGLRDMHALGVLSRLPRMLGVQAEGARPLVDAFLSSTPPPYPSPTEGGGKAPGPHTAPRASPEPFPYVANPHTVADSICVGHPRNWRKALRAVRESGGALVAVPDADILDALRECGQRAGVFGEPAAVAGLAGLRAAVEAGIVGPRESALAVVTGSGLKDVRTAVRTIGAPVDLPPDDDALDAHLRERPL